MDSWKFVLKGDPTDWLLEENNPSVRYFTLVDILGKTKNKPEVRATKENIMETGVVPGILAKQKDGGYWGKPEDFYIRSKYRGTVWSLIILTELGADRNDERVADHHRSFPGVRDVRYMKRTQRQGGFSSVKNGEPPIRLTRAAGEVTYVLYWELDSEITHGKTTKSGLEYFSKDFRRYLFSKPKIILGERIQ